MLYKIKRTFRHLYKSNRKFSALYTRMSRVKTLTLRVLDDRTYIKLKYRLSMGKKLDIDNPVTFNEKLQWLKLNDRNPLYTQLVDKYLVREYVEQRIGAQYLNSLLGTYDCFRDVPFHSLPEKYVIKCNHDCGSIEICDGKNKLDIKKMKSKFDKALKRNYYWCSREWPYKNVKPRIVVEAFLSGEDGDDLPDYKFFCFNGEPVFLFIATERQNEHEETRFDFFDMEGRHLSVKSGHPNADVLPKMPRSFELMKNLARSLSLGIPFVRVDFYEVNGKPIFGEMTFYHWGGMVPFEPEYWDKRFGEYIDLGMVKARNLRS